MRSGVGILIFLVVFIFMTDMGLAYLLKKRRAKHKLPPFRLWHFLSYWIVPFVFLITFFIVFTLFKDSTSNRAFYNFIWINWIFILVYGFKMVYGAYLAFLEFTAKKAKGEIRVPVNQHYKKGKRISRSEFLGRMGLVAAGLPFISMFYGMSKGRFNYFIKNVPLKFKNLPSSFDGFKIIQISDLHLGNYNREYHHLYPIVEMINESKPDLIVFTGDLVNNFASETIGWDSLFSKLRAPYGKYSVLGNHDYGNYSRWRTDHDKAQNFRKILQAHERFGFKLLNNDHKIIQKGSESIALTGVENWGHPPFPQYGDLKKALQGTESTPFNVLLSHDPDHFDAEVINSPVDLMLAGHTHGMQMGIQFKNFKWSPAKWKFKYWDGLYQIKDKALYVNRGLGFVGIPMRVGMPPEITLIELQKA